MLNNFKDPDGLTASWLEKLAGFDYEVQHKPGKSIGHADGHSRLPLVNQVTIPQSVEKLDEPLKTNFFQLIHKNGNLFESSDSLAHCILWTSKCPRKLPEVSNAISRTNFQRASTVHFLSKN